MGESCGVLCGPKELGWDTDVLPETQAVMLPDDAMAGKAIPSYEVCVEAFNSRQVVPSEQRVSGNCKKKRAAMKAHQKKQDDKNFEAALVEAGFELLPEPASKALAKSKAKAKANPTNADEVDVLGLAGDGGVESVSAAAAGEHQRGEQAAVADKDVDART